jgi:transcriptional regulator with XRE-family HTH domain
MALVKRYVSMAYIMGSTLRQQREAAGFSQQHLAERISAATGLEISQPIVCRWENSYEFAVERETAEQIITILSAL